MAQTIENRGTFVITGGNSGLGYALAKRIAMQDQNSHIVLACRDAARATDAVRSLVEQTGNGNITAMHLDLASLESVRCFVNEFETAGNPPLQALICNAGVISLNAMHETSDGFEATFGVNHLGHFLLAALLARDVIDTGRIIFVSSGTHDPANKTLVAAPVYDNAKLLAYPPIATESGSTAGQRRYSTSKLCNVYCAYELAKQVQRVGKHIDVNVFDPGEMPGTGFSRGFPAPMRLFAKYVNYLSVPFRRGVHTPSQSARALAALATSPAFAGVTGKYFDGTEQKASSDLSYDVENRKDLWRTSIELSGITATETILKLE